MYITYDEYISFGGKLSETEFYNFADKAEMKISAETFKRIYNVDDDTRTVVKKCISRIISLICKREALLNGSAVSSFSHDGLSQSLSMPTAGDCKSEINKTIKLYLTQCVDLNGTPLLYLGVSRYA